MKTALLAVPLGAALLALAACGPEPQPLTGHTSFTACVGRAGNCSESCCAYSKTRVISEGPRELDCKMFSGAIPTELRVDFRIVSADNQTAVVGKQLRVDNFTGSPVPVRICDGFEIREEGNTYPSVGCSQLDLRSDFPFGGGCEVEMHLDAEEVIVGRFRCKELQLPAQDLYFSTVYGGNVGWGEFRFENCADRR